MTIQVKQNQTIWDIALQYAGSIEAAFDILEANGKSDTTLFIGESLFVPKVVNKKVAQFFESETAIATSLEPLSEDAFVTIENNCLPVSFTINDNSIFTAQSGENITINIVNSELHLIGTIDGNQIVVPDTTVTIQNNEGHEIAQASVVSATNAIVQISNCPQTGIKPFKTGQIQIFNAGDDGSTQRGQELDTLPFLNAFGSPYRFTALDGSQNFIQQGNPVGLGVDWSTWNGKSGSEVMFFSTGNLSSIANTDYINVLNNIQNMSIATSLGIINGFNMCNLSELTRLTRMTTIAFGINYFPLLGEDILICLTSTINPLNTQQVMARLTNGSISGVNITGGGNKRSIAIRYATVHIENGSVIYTY